MNSPYNLFDRYRQLEFFGNKINSPICVTKLVDNFEKITHIMEKNLTESDLFYNIRHYDKNACKNMASIPYPFLMIKDKSNIFMRFISKIFNSYHINEVSAIRLVRLDAPQSVQAGQPIILRCLADSKRDRLQSLSWYKNGREFYRYQPFDRAQPILVFNLTGINVDVSLITVKI